MSAPTKKTLTASDMGRRGGASKSKRKIAAVRKNLEKARKKRWVDNNKRFV